LPGPNEFVLSEELVPKLQNHISWAAQEAENKVEGIMRSYHSTVGTAAWTSSAANAALSVQVNENHPKWKKLMQVLTDLSDAVNKAAGIQADGVEQGRQAIQAAAGGATGGGSAMATNYQSRMA
jgi:hypothetical protein